MTLYSDDDTTIIICDDGTEVTPPLYRYTRHAVRDWLHHNWATWCDRPRAYRHRLVRVYEPHDMPRLITGALVVALSIASLATVAVALLS